jgi:hypothetical protein
MKTRIFSRRARHALGGLLALVALAGSARAELVISEFLASNAHTLADETAPTPIGLKSTIRTRCR